MARALTERKRQILRLILANPGISRRELADELGVSSLATVQNHLEDLQDRGLIEWDHRSPRTIRLTEAGYRALGTEPEYAVALQLARDYPRFRLDLFLRAWRQFSAARIERGGGVK